MSRAESPYVELSDAIDDLYAFALAYDHADCRPDVGVLLRIHNRLTRAQEQLWVPDEEQADAERAGA
jgi:hypothetical protein